MADETKSHAVAWYRTRMDPKVLKSLHVRSDARGLLQALSHLGLVAFTGAFAFYAAGRLPVPVVALLFFLHGMFYAFLHNGIHELAHGTVFQSKFLNSAFLRIFAFLGWYNFRIFEASHIRHHRYTLHPPDDLEVVLPIKIMIRNFFLEGFVNLTGTIGLYQTLKETIRIARGKLRGQWELTLFPESSPERQLPVNWARTLLLGHGLIVVICLYFKLWLVPLLITFAPFYGGWLCFLCNNTQHIGLQDNVSDFRLCSRTFIPHPFVQFLYWKMNYHIEHHMYAAVPCYHLKKLHQLIKYDLPHCPQGLIETWKQIAAIQKEQKTNPAYQYIAPLPKNPTIRDNLNVHRNGPQLQDASGALG